MPKSHYLLMGSVIIFLFFSLSLGLTVNASLCSVNATKEETEPSYTLGRIRADYDVGKLTVDQYVLYRAWAVLSPSMLLDTKYTVPLEETQTYRKLVTMIILEAKENWQKLGQETREQLGWIFLRPTDSDGGIDDKQHLLPSLYHTEHFVIHYTDGTDGGNADDAPELTDVNPSNGIPDYVENYASYFEYTYNFEVGNKMFNAPPSDAAEPNDANNRNPDGKYDVFIYNLGMGYYGYTDPEQYPNTPSYSYIAVNKNYDWASNPYNQDPDGFKKGAMKVTAAHEFFHAIQYTYDVKEVEWWMETTSTYMEDEVYPLVNDNYYYLPYWFENCDWYGIESTVGLHEYGNFIFAKRLSEDFGDAVIREIWTEMQGTDGLTAIDNVLNSKGSNIVREFNKFMLANFFLEDMYPDGVDYRQAVTGKTTFNGVYLEYQYKEVTDGIPFVIDDTNVKRNAWMDEWAADYITITISGPTSYIIAFEGLDDTTQYDVSLVTKIGAVINAQDFALNAYKDGRMELAYNPGYSKVVLIIRNSGNTYTKTPSWRVVIAPKGIYEVTFYTNPALDGASITFDSITYINNEIGNYNMGDYTATANFPNANYLFDHWEYSGSSGSGVYVPNNITNPTTVKVKGDGWLRAVFQKIAYTVTVRTSGLSYSHRTHVYVDGDDKGEPYLYDGNSREFTFPAGESHKISVAVCVQGWSAEERYHCPSNSTTVNTDATIVFEYHEENLITFEHQGSGGNPQVTVDDVTYSLPCDLWLDAEVEHTFEYESPVAGDTGVRYALSYTSPYTSPYKFTYPTTVRGYYKTQFFITINSAHGTPTDSRWVDKGSSLSVSVTSPAETVEGQTRWICTGYKIDDGELKKDTSYYFWSVNSPHKIEFYWVQQFWLQLDTDIAGPNIIGTGWYDAGTSATISATTPYQASPTHRFIFASWTSTGTNAAQITAPKSSSTTVTIDNYYSIEAKWQEQFYITVISDHGDPTPSQWVNTGNSLSASVTSPTDDDGKGTRYRCTGYKIDFEDTQEGTSYTFTNVQAAHKIEFQWITQYEVTFSETGVETGRSITITVDGKPHVGTATYTYSEWFDEDFSVTFSITDPIDSATSGKRYVVMNWKNSAGSVITSPQTISGPNTFTASYLTQCYLTVNTNPSDLSPQPSVSPPGPWYDDHTTVTLTAQSISGYTFDHWTVDGTNQGYGISTITVNMYESHTTTAHYKPAESRWQLYLIALFVVLAVVFIIAILLKRR